MLKASPLTHTVMEIESTESRVPNSVTSQKWTWLWATLSRSSQKWVQTGLFRFFSFLKFNEIHSLWKNSNTCNSFQWKLTSHCRNQKNFYNLQKTLPPFLFLLSKANLEKCFHNFGYGESWAFWFVLVLILSLFETSSFYAALAVLELTKVSPASLPPPSAETNDVGFSH